jgi:hypothetical protein
MRVPLGRHKKRAVHSALLDTSLVCDSQPRLIVHMIFEHMLQTIMHYQKPYAIVNLRGLLLWQHYNNKGFSCSLN